MELDRHEGYSFDWMTWVDVQHSAVESALAHSQYNKKYIKTNKTCLPILHLSTCNDRHIQEAGS